MRRALSRSGGVPPPALKRQKIIDFYKQDNPDDSGSRYNSNMAEEDFQSSLGFGLDVGGDDDGWEDTEVAESVLHVCEEFR